MRKYISELIGTFVLVFVGTAAVTIAHANVVGIGLAFGLAVTIMAYSVGAISGGHFNPALLLECGLTNGLAVQMPFIT